MSDIYLFRSTMRDVMRPKRLLVALVLIVIPAALALLVRIADRGRLGPTAIYNFLSEYVIFGFLLVMLAVVFATGVITQEIQQKTIVYLLTRPVPRWRICLVKFVAAILAIIVTVCAASALLALATYGPAKLADSHLGR